jgi:hypothetical protein
MSKEYKKACTSCGQNIVMCLSITSGKWIALELDGNSFHRCKQQQQLQQSQQQQIPTTTATP